MPQTLSNIILGCNITMNRTICLPPLTESCATSYRIMCCMNKSSSRLIPAKIYKRISLKLITHTSHKAGYILLHALTLCTPPMGNVGHLWWEIFNGKLMKRWPHVLITVWFGRRVSIQCCSVSCPLSAENQYFYSSQLFVTEHASRFNRPIPRRVSSFGTRQN